jgi:hypothetical protein
MTTKNRSHKRIGMQTKTVSELLYYVDERRFAIPKLQREFIWDGPKAAKLFDSILTGIPIGVVMVWVAPRSQRSYLRQDYHVLPSFDPRNPEVWFLIDGQQRISVLHHVCEGSTLQNARHKEIEFRRVVFSLEKEEDGQQIRYRKPIRGRYESMCDVLHPRWYSRLGHLGKRDKERVQKCRDQVLGYPMYVMFIQAKIDQIQETFLRINTQGMKITTADAIFTRAKDIDLRDFCHEVRQHIDYGFGQPPETPILFAMAAVQGATEARGRALNIVTQRLARKAKADPRLRRTLSKEWHRLGVCFGKAVDYLRQNFSVLSREYLSSDHMIAMLALFFFRNGRGPSASQKEQVRRWFWSTSVGSRYSGRNFSRCIPDDLKFFTRLSQNENARFTSRCEVDRIEVRKAQFASGGGITSAFYCMMLKRRPVSILDNGINEIHVERYSTPANRKDRHHIFPRAALSGVGVDPSLYNSICNICLLTAEENQSIGSKTPRSYLAEVRDNGTYFKRKMNRHLIPIHADSGVWQSNIKRGFARFLQERMNLICSELEAAAGMRLFRRQVW